MEDLTAAPYPPLRRGSNGIERMTEAESFRGLDNIMIAIELVASNGRHRRLEGTP